MKKIYVSVTMFIIMMLVIFFSINYLHKIYHTLKPISIQLEENISSENWDESSKLVDQLNKEWAKHGNILFIFVHHAEIDNISEEMNKLTQYVKYHIKEDCMASLYTIKFFFAHILELEQLSIKNIL